MYNETMLASLNTQLVYLLHAFARSADLITYVTIFFARYADLLVIACVGVFLFVHQHQKAEKDPTILRFWRKVKEIIIVLGTAFCAWLVAVFLKMNIEAARPFMTMSIEPLFWYGGLDSFPSGHATFFMALAVAVGMHHRWLGLMIGGMAVLISIARVMAGIHYPGDVIVGWLLGWVLAVGVYRISVRLRTWYFGNRT